MFSICSPRNEGKYVRVVSVEFFLSDIHFQGTKIQSLCSLPSQKVKGGKKKAIIKLTSLDPALRLSLKPVFIFLFSLFDSDSFKIFTVDEH